MVIGVDMYCWCVFTCVLMDLTQRSAGARCSCSGQTDTEVWVLWDGIKLCVCVCGSLIASTLQVIFCHHTCDNDISQLTLRVNLFSTLLSSLHSLTRPDC